MTVQDEVGPADRDRVRGFSAIDRLARTARDMQSLADRQAVLELAVRAAVANVDGCDSATVTLLARGRDPRTPVSTDAAATAGDELQYALEEGPCLAAIWDEPVVHAADLERDDRWPVWGPRVFADYGTASLLAVRLFTHADTLGALNLYSRSRGSFGAEARDEALALAAHVAVAVAAIEQIDQLGEALDTRTLIGQATGILMERYGVDPQRAFGLLARVSSESNIKVRELARQVVEEGALRPDGGRRR